MNEEEEAEEEEADSVADLAEAADLDASLEGLDERPVCSLLEPGKNEEDDEEEEEEEEDEGNVAPPFLRLVEELGAGQELTFLFGVRPGGCWDSERRFLDLAVGGAFGSGSRSVTGSVSSDCSELSGGGALGRLAGLGE